MFLRFNFPRFPFIQLYPSHTAFIPAGGTTKSPHPVDLPSLPQEIVDNVIDQLAADLQPNKSARRPRHDLPAATLVACTLVCRAWLPRSSKYVLENIKADHSLNALDQLLAHAKSSPRLSFNVRSLCIPHWTDEKLLVHALEVLSKLSSVYFLANDLRARPRAVIDTEDNAQRVPSSMGSRYHIGRLDFERFYIPCVLRYLALFQSIDSLHLGTMRFKSKTGVGDLEVPDKTQDLRLTTLTVGANNASVLRLIQPMLAPGSLRSLHIENVVTNDRLFLQPFLQESCSRLGSFHAEVHSFMWHSPRTNRTSI